jgi:hypothetical protein
VRFSVDLFVEGAIRGTVVGFFEIAEAKERLIGPGILEQRRLPIY